MFHIEFQFVRAAWQVYFPSHQFITMYLVIRKYWCPLRFRFRLMPLHTYWADSWWWLYNYSSRWTGNIFCQSRLIEAGYARRVSMETVCVKLIAAWSNNIRDIQRKFWSNMESNLYDVVSRYRIGRNWGGAIIGYFDRCDAADVMKSYWKCVQSGAGQAEHLGICQTPFDRDELHYEQYTRNQQDSRPQHLSRVSVVPSKCDHVNCIWKIVTRIPRPAFFPNDYLWTPEVTIE